MTQKTRRRGFLASREGLKKLEARMREKGYTQEKLAEEADVGLDRVKRLCNPQWGKKIQKDGIEEIAKILDLEPPDIVDGWYLPGDTSEQQENYPSADLPNWRKVCRAMLNTQNELTTNPLTRNDGIEFERDEIYVPLGLVERPKREKRRDDVSPEKGSQLYEPTEEEIKIVGKYELDAVCEQLLKQGDGQDQSQGRSIAAIIGEPGAGKSTLQQKIADWVFHNTEADVPILVSLGAIGNKSLNQYLMEDWLQNAAQELDAAPPEWKQAFGQLLKSGGVWLLLDGADEMAVDSPLGQIAAQLREGWAQNLRLVLTCRLNVWDAGKNALEGFKIYRTLEFSYGNANTPDQVGQFISNWFKHSEPERGKNLRAALDQRGKERIKDLVKNPLRLALLCRTWQLWEGGLPDTKAVLYQQFVEAIYLWKDKEFSTTSDQRKLLNEKLGQLALQAIDRKDSRFRLLESFVRDLLGEPDEEGSLFWLALRLGWLNKVGVAAENPGERVYAFFHPTFQEYFAALAVEDWHVFLNHFPHAPIQGSYHIFESQWKEVILLWLGRKDVQCQQKENFVRVLLEFQDGCGNFYYLRSLFLACAGIAEFNECSLAIYVLIEITKCGFGYLNSETQIWTEFPSIAEEAKAALLETEPNWAIKLLGHILGKILKTAKNKLSCWEAAWYSRQIGSEEIAVEIDKILIHLLCIRQNKDDDPFINWVLPQLGIRKSAIIATLINILHKGAEKLRDDVYKTSNALPCVADGKLEPILDLILICKNAARFLGKIGTGESNEITALIEILNITHEPDILKQAIQSLGELTEHKLQVFQSSSSSADDDLWKTVKYDTINTFTKFLSAEHLDSIRFYAARSLRKNEPHNPLVITTLIDLLYNSIDEDIVQKIIAYIDLVYLELLESDILKIIKVIEHLLVSSINDEIRYRAALTLRKIALENPSFISSMTSLMLDSQDEFISCMAAHELWKINPQNPLVVPALIDLMYKARKREIFTYHILQESIDLEIFNTGDIEVINALTEIISNSENEGIRWEAAYHLWNLDPDNPKITITLIALLQNTQDEKLLRKVIFKDLAVIGDEDSEVVTSLTHLLNLTRNETTRWRVATVLANINPSDKKAINTLTEILEITQQENIRKAIAETLIEINTGKPKVIDALIHLLQTSQDRDTCKWAAQNLKKIIPATQFPSIVAALKDCETGQSDDKNLNRGILCEEILWHCAQNMPYPDFYRAWRGNDNIPMGDSSIAQTLEKQFTSIAEQLQPTDKTYPIIINAQALQGETDTSAIAQELCNQIYLTAFPDEPEIPEVSNAPQLKRLIPPIKKQLQKQNLALIVDKCEPNQEQVTFCRKLSDVLHIAWITNQPIEPPLKGFLPNQPNLFSAIQSWIDEID
jgi:HEAT repeat protein